jgi:hypothetical protein
MWVPERAVPLLLLQSRSCWHESSEQLVHCQLQINRCWHHLGPSCVVRVEYPRFGEWVYFWTHSQKSKHSAESGHFGEWVRFRAYNFPTIHTHLPDRCIFGFWRKWRSSIQNLRSFTRMPNHRQSVKDFGTFFTCDSRLSTYVAEYYIFRDAENGQNGLRENNGWWGPESYFFGIDPS